MKIGVLLIFYNNEKYINTFLKQVLHNFNNQLEFCLLNNGSKDATYGKLLDLKQLFPNLTIVDVKRNKGLFSAIKAGTRYLINEINVKYIGYIDFENCNPENLENLLISVSLNKELFVVYNHSKQKNSIQRSLIKNVFSIQDYQKVLKAEYASDFVELSTS